LTDFFIVNAIPLESERFDLKIDDLQRNHTQLSKLFEDVDPQLLVNIDKCGWGKMITQGENMLFHSI
jgi:hypothetical protein